MITATSNSSTNAAAAAGAARRRVVLATFGSFGDLHPYIALGLGLKARGHDAVLATSGFYRKKVEGEGLGFHPVRPDFEEGEATLEMVRKIMDPRAGTEFIMRDVLMPHIRDQYEDLHAAAEGADLLVSHCLTYGIRLVAELHGLPWVATFLQPMVFTSPYDPPIPPQAPGMAAVYRLGPGFTRALLRFAKARLRPLMAPLEHLRADLGLPPTEHPMFEGSYSPHLNLALFSRVIGPPQPDWPANTVVTGFPFYDRLEPGAVVSPELLRFLDAGPPPVVFTLGSSAVMRAGSFYLESLEAVRRLGCRAVFLVGTADLNRLPAPLPEGVLAVPYAPHGDLFPRAAAIVHQSGVGTTGQSLRAGKPVLAVPFAHDQPDNAHRLARLGMARVLPPHRYTAARAAADLHRLLREPSYAARAAEVGRQVREEEGVSAACDAIERLLSGVRRPGS